MRRGPLFVALVVVGFVVGATVGAALDDEPAPSSSAVAPDPSRTTVVVEQRSPTAAASEDQVLLAWTPGGLPSGFAGAVGELPGVAASTAVRGDTVDLVRSWDQSGAVVDDPPDGMAVPLDAIAVEPLTYPAVLPDADRQVFRGLLPGEALLGASSAALRGLDVGARLELAGGSTLTVTDVVDDELVGAAELVVSALGAPDLGIGTERYVLLVAAGERTTIEAGVRSLATAAGAPVRVRAPGEAPFLRSSDAVLPQVLVKQVFGEFAYVPPGPGEEVFEQSPAWAAEHLAVEAVPLLGEVRCHRALLPALRGAMQELVDRNLGHLVQSFDGCTNPRLIAPGASISRHAWGAAVDLNFSGNPTGRTSIQDDRLVAVMEDWGFVSGDDWLVPDPGHFEHLTPPRP